jgi:thymidylate synthase
VREQLSRDPYPLPTVRVRKAASIFDYTFDDFEIVDYVHHPAIKGAVAV